MEPHNNIQQQNNNNTTSVYETFINNYMTLCNNIIDSMNTILRQNNNIINIDIMTSYFENTNIVLNSMVGIEGALRSNIVNSIPIARQNLREQLDPLNSMRTQTQPVNISPITTTQPLRVPPIIQNIRDSRATQPPSIGNIGAMRQPHNYNIIPLTYYTTTIPLDTPNNDAITSFIDTIMSPLLNRFSEPFPIRPTLAQINNSTTVTIFHNDNQGDEQSDNQDDNPDSDNTNDSCCPIDLAPFIEGDEIITIIHCNHTFRYSNLRTWFNTSPTCPVCRYDIRNFVQVDNIPRNTQTIIQDNHDVLDTDTRERENNRNTDNISVSNSDYSSIDSMSYNSDNDTDNGSHDYNMSYFE